jgi:hypothetical protein
MAKIFPFRSLRYALNKVPIEKVVTQPYDKISTEMQDRYYALHPNNIIRIILGKGTPDDTASNNVYTRAAAYLKEWRDSGVHEHLRSRRQPVRRLPDPLPSMAPGLRHRRREPPQRTGGEFHRPAARARLRAPQVVDAVSDLGLSKASRQFPTPNFQLPRRTLRTFRAKAVSTSLLLRLQPRWLERLVLGVGSWRLGVDVFGFMPRRRRARDRNGGQGT